MLHFEVKTEVYFGRGERENLLQYLSERNLSRCGAVVDSGLLSYDVFKALLSKLEKGLKYFKVLPYDYGKEPTYGYLDKIKGFFKQGELDCLIGIGGGSAIDTTKALAVLINNPVQKAIELRGFPQIAKLPLLVVAIPTISGTGTEVTYYAVFNDEIEKRKLGINTKHNFPIFTIADPELTVMVPFKQSISTALDCMVHALETFMSKKATFITRPLSIEAFYYAFLGTRALLKDIKDIEARENLMRGSYMAGISLMNSSGGPAGALSSPLGTLFSVPHGIAGAFFIQHILKFNLSKGYTDFYLLCDRINGPSSISSEKKAEKMVKDILEIIKKAGVPGGLSAFGVDKNGIAAIFNQFTAYWPKAFEVNPIYMTHKGLNKFLEKMLNI